MTWPASSFSVLPWLCNHGSFSHTLKTESMRWREPWGRPPEFHRIIKIIIVDCIKWAAHKMSTRKVRPHSNWLCCFVFFFRSFNCIRFLPMIDIMMYYMLVGFFPTSALLLHRDSLQFTVISAGTVKWNRNTDEIAKRMMNKDNINDEKKSYEFCVGHRNVSNWTTSFGVHDINLNNLKWTKKQLKKTDISNCRWNQTNTLEYWFHLWDAFI